MGWIESGLKHGMPHKRHVDHGESKDTFGLYATWRNDRKHNTIINHAFFRLCNTCFHITFSNSGFLHSFSLVYPQMPAGDRQAPWHLKGSVHEVWGIYRREKA
jgi:hypothetical protein